MGYAFLLNTEASLATFRQTFDVLNDVKVAYCHESEISLHRGANTAFFLLMAILEGGVRFPVDPLLLNTLRYYGLCPNQLPPNFYRVVSCVSRLNQTFNLQLEHHDINHMYSLYGNKSSNYYLKVRDMRARLTNCRIPEEPTEPKAPTHETEQVAVEFINSSDTKSNRGGDMVTQKTMTIDSFVLGARQVTQQQPT